MSYYGIAFSTDIDGAPEYDTYAMYGLILLEDGFSISEPALKASYIDIPGSDGALDASDLPQGYPTFEQRTLRCSLIKPGTTWAEMTALRQTLMSLWQGRTCRIWLPDDTEHYWHGRPSFGALEDPEILTVTATVYPYALGTQSFFISGELTTEDQSFTVPDPGRFVVPSITTEHSIVVQMYQGYDGIPPAVTLTVAQDGTAQTFHAPQTLMLPGVANGFSLRTVRSVEGATVSMRWRGGRL